VPSPVINSTILSGKFRTGSIISTGNEELFSPCYNRPMAEFGKILLGVGLFLVVLGALLLASRFGLPIGRLPGDLHWRSRSGQTQFYFPIATSILLSVLFSLLLWLLRSFRR
jgi:hypothetical protein